METRTLLLVLAAAALVLALVSLAIASRIWNTVVPSRIKLSVATYKASFPPAINSSSAKSNKEPTSGANKVRTMVVLGSGGHTTEMLKLMKRFDRDTYSPIAFVVAATDKTSQEKTVIDWQPRDVDSFVVIPRSREVSMAMHGDLHAAHYSECIGTNYTTIYMSVEYAATGGPVVVVERLDDAARVSVLRHRSVRVPTPISALQWTRCVQIMH